MITTEAGQPLEPFTINIDQSVLDDLVAIDHILTSPTMYWVNPAIGTSIHAYKKPNLYPWTPSHDRQPPVQAPAGFTLLIGDRSPFDGGHTPEERLAAFKVPVKFVFAPAPLPRNPTGKLMKGELKRLFVEQKV